MRQREKGRQGEASDLPEATHSSRRLVFKPDSQPLGGAFVTGRLCCRLLAGIVHASEQRSPSWIVKDIPSQSLGEATCRIAGPSGRGFQLWSTAQAGLLGRWHLSVTSKPRLGGASGIPPAGGKPDVNAQFRLLYCGTFEGIWTWTREMKRKRSTSPAVGWKARNGVSWRGSSSRPSWAQASGG